MTRWKLTEEREGVRKCGVVADIDAHVKWRSGCNNARLLTSVSHSTPDRHLTCASKSAYFRTPSEIFILFYFILFRFIVRK